MDDNLKKIIQNSSFRVEEGEYIYAKVKSAPVIDKHFLVSKDEDEITVVTKKENLPDLDLIEKNKDTYCLIGLKVSLPFYAVGFLASVTKAIADRGMNVLVVSTYSKDYILVRVEHREKAIEALEELGLSHES
jgi:hypothetical protein